MRGLEFAVHPLELETSQQRDAAEVWLAMSGVELDVTGSTTLVAEDSAGHAVGVISFGLAGEGLGKRIRYSESTSAEILDTDAPAVVAALHAQMHDLSQKLSIPESPLS